MRRGKVTINRRGEMTADERRLDNRKKKRRVKNQRARLRSDAGRLANENRELREALARLVADEVRDEEQDYCELCGAGPYLRHPHTDDCPWVAARKLLAG